MKWFKKKYVLNIIALTFILIIYQACGNPFDSNQYQEANSSSSVDVDKSLPETFFFQSNNKIYTEKRFYRLTNKQIENSINSLLKIKSDISEKLPEQPSFLGYTNNSDVLTVSEDFLNDYLEIIESAAQLSVSNLSNLISCSGDITNSCLKLFLTEFLKSAFHGQSNQQTVDKYINAYSEFNKNFDQKASFSLILQAILASNNFLFVDEGVLPGKQSYLSAYKIKLSNMIISSKEIEDLKGFDLGTKKGRSSVVSYFIEKKEFISVFKNFINSWLGAPSNLSELKNLKKEDDLFKNDNFLKAVLTDHDKFIENIISSDGSPLKNLIMSTKSFISKPLADIYQVSETLTTETQEVQLDPTKRAGLLTRSLYIQSKTTATDSHPIKQGSFIASNVFCQELPPLPRDADISLKEDNTPGLTKKQQFAKHSSSPACASCHKILDPGGFALENYDSLGRYRDKENGTQIDASVNIEYLPLSAAVTNTPIEFMQFVSESPEFYQCFVKQAFRFLYGREELAGDDPTMRAAYRAFADSNYNIKVLFTELLSNESFITRR